MSKKPVQRLSVGFLYDDTLDNDAGVAQYVKTLGAWLSGRGHRVSYLVGETKIDDWAGGKVFSLARNLAVVFNGNRLSMPRPANRSKIRQILKNNNFDVIHVQMPYSPLLAKRVINNLPPSTAIIGTFHIYPSSFISSFGSKILKILLGRSLKKIDTVISVSQPAADFAKKAYSLESTVVPNMVDLKKFQSSKQTNKNRIIFLGRLVERKGAMYLLKAFKVIAQELKDIELIIAGDGPQRKEMERFVARGGLSGRVKFLGYIEEAKKADILSSAGVVCFPSLHGESFGIVLIEAMASGAKVVIGGNNPGYSSVLGQDSGTLFDPRDTAGFAGILKKYLTDPSAIAVVHKKQQELVKQFDVGLVGQKVESIYSQAIAPKSKTGHN